MLEAVKQERLEWLADNPFYSKRFAFFVGRRCRAITVKDVAEKLTWIGRRSRSWTSSICESRCAERVLLAPGSSVSTRSRSARGIPIASWSATFCDDARSGLAARIAPKRAWTSSLRGSGQRKATRLACGHGHVESVSQVHLNAGHAPQAAILFDKFHVLRHLGEALDKVRKKRVRPADGKDSRFVKGQKYTLLSHRENLTTKDGAA